jgi:hypothetical protein
VASPRWQAREDLVGRHATAKILEPGSSHPGDHRVTTGDEVFRRLQSKARSDGAKAHSAPPTSEYLTRYALESFLDRLTKTSHADDFVLKGGILLTAYGFRRPTKDADAEAINATVDRDHLAKVMADIAAVEVDDGVAFDLDGLDIQDIREHGEYPGLRLRVPVRLGNWRGVAAWDVSTGDPIIPKPRVVEVPRVLGGSIRLLGYAPETTIAEKGVTILERGTSSTRWRDYIDIVHLFNSTEINPDEVLASARAVALHRGVDLGPIAPVVSGYGDVGQVKWSAWRRKEHMEFVSEEQLDDQMGLVTALLDPIFSQGFA